MPGYSGTPLPKKLGIKDGYRVGFSNLPPDVEKELKDSLPTCKIATTGPYDFSMIFVKTQSELHKQFARYQKQLAATGMLWVSWPKKTSGIPSDLDENIIRNFGLKAGLVDVKVCAVTEVWSGLKFVIRLKDR